MYNCPYCHKWLKESTRYHKCRYIPIESQRPKFKAPTHHEIPNELEVYSDKITLGFDMLQDDYED